MDLIQALDVVVFGIAVIFIGVVVLLIMVHNDLGPVAGLGLRRRWLLTAALGSGVLAFSFKILFIIALSQYPRFAERNDPIQNKPITIAATSPTPEKAYYLWDPVPVANKPNNHYPIHQGIESYQWNTLPSPQPLTKTMSARVALGRQLFFDKQLSYDRSLSCASCHNVDNGAGDDGRKTAVGIGGRIGNRNTPTVWNSVYQTKLFWDGRAASLEEQAIGPMLNPIEMGMPSTAAVVERVSANTTYPPAFAAAYNGDDTITIERITEAIASFERTLITNDTPYDRFVQGDATALTLAQRRGMALFGSVGCINCHSGPNFSAASRVGENHMGDSPLRLFPTTPTPYEEQYALTQDRGAADNSTDRGLWRVPSLRNVALTAPYFHNGAVDDLEEAVRIMSAVQLGHTAPMLMWSNQNKVMRRIGGEPLSDRAVKDIVQFLHALSSDTIVTRIANAKLQEDKPIRYAAN